MDDIIEVEISKGQSYVLTETYLHVGGDYVTTCFCTDWGFCTDWDGGRGCMVARTFFS